MNLHPKAMIRSKPFRVDENRVHLTSSCNRPCEAEFTSCVRRRLRTAISETESNFEVPTVFKKEAPSSCCSHWLTYIENT